MAQLVRLAGRSVAAISIAFAVVLGAGVLTEGTALAVSDAVYPVVAITTGALLLAGARFRVGRDRHSWTLFGVGVVLLGLGEAAWAWYELVRGVEPPYPGIADAFYLLAYPVFLVAILVAPRLASNWYQRGEQVLDALVVTAGLAVLAWYAVLEPMYSTDVSNPIELVVGAAYPFGDVALITAVLAMAWRRHVHVRDRALWCVIGALVVTAAGDIVYLVQSWSDTYVSGSWVDSTWIAGYALFAAAASLLPTNLERSQPRDRRLPMWQLLPPVAVVMLVVSVHIATHLRTQSAGDIAVEVGLTILGIMALGRILLSVADDRRLVELERRQLVSVVSHELRTPLTAVQGYLDLVLGDWDALNDAARRDMVSIAQHEAQLVARIVTDLVDTTRDTLHSTRLDVTAVDAEQVVHHAISAIEMRSVVSVGVDADAVVLADPDRFTQIITNLLSNADRYGRGTVVCIARRVGIHVEISVHDDGPGVPARYRDTIWDRFERGTHRFDAQTPGSGLGLAIVRSLVVAHGGRCGYRQSDILGGACFWIQLPAATSRLDQIVLHDAHPSRPVLATRA